jgi:hypothetical protein
MFVESDGSTLLYTYDWGEIINRLPDFAWNW